MNYEELEEKNDYYYENNIGSFFSPNINNFSYSSDFNDHFYYRDQFFESENKNEIDPFIINKPDVYIDQFQHEKKTSCTTNYKNIIRKKCSNREPPKILDNVKIKEEMPPTPYSFDDIIDKIFMNKDYKEKFKFDANNIFIKDEKLEKPYLNKKRLRDSDCNDSDLYEVLEKENIQYYEQENRIKRGRKPKDGEGWGHDKMSADNIIKKLKAEFFKYMTLFLNKIIKTTTSEENDKILKLDYRFINQLNREIDLKFLKLPLKDLFSLDVSPKY
jgi:hypothetical protein